MIEFYTDGIALRDARGEIINKWTEDEWREDPEMIYSILEAVRKHYEEGED